jgi:hypothetical protein
MFRSQVLTALGLIAACPLTFAQSVAVAGPVSGFIYDGGSLALRPIIGIPGAAYVGASVFSGVGFAAVAPNGSLAIARLGGALSLVSGLETGSPTLLRLDSPLDGVDRVTWAPDSAIALLFASSARKFQRVHVSATAPVVDAPVDVPAQFGDPAALAIAPSGLVAVAFRGAPAGLYLASPGGALEFMAALDDPGAAVFTYDGRGLFVLDRGSSLILQISNLPDAAVAAPFVDLTGSGSNPIDLAVSRDGRYLYVAASGAVRRTRSGSERLASRQSQLRPSPASCVLVFETASHSQSVSLLLDAAPTQMQSLSKSLYALNAVSAGAPLLVLDTSTDPRTWFVPVLNED